MPDQTAPERIWRLPRYSSSGYIYVTTRPKNTGALVVTEYIRADKAREQVAASMMRCSLATGHGDTIEDLLAEMEWQVRELRERLVAAKQKVVRT